MDNLSGENVGNSPLMEYEITKLVLQNLSNIRQLNNAARVCKSWSKTAKILKKSRHHIYHAANRESHENFENIQELLSTIQSQPMLCITFLTHINYEDIPLPLNDSGGLTAEGIEKSRPKGRYTEYALLQFLHNNLPHNCNILGGLSCGVVLSGPSLETVEIEDGNAYGMLLLPELPGVTMQNFYLDKKNMRKAVNAISSQEDQIMEVLRLKNHENIKSILLLGSNAYKESKCLESLCRYFQEQKNQDIAIGGGFVEAVIHPEVFDRERECGILGLVFSGKDVKATSFIIPPHVTNENDIENILKTVTQKHTGLQENRKRKSIGFMFACVARGSHVHGQPGVEAALFRKHFPLTPLLGFFGNGEIGASNVDCAPAYIPPKRPRPSFLHSYSTVFVVISFPID